MRKAFTIIELLMVIFMMALLTGAGFIVYGAAHFISKYW